MDRRISVTRALLRALLRAPLLARVSASHYPLAHSHTPSPILFSLPPLPAHIAGRQPTVPIPRGQAVPGEPAPELGAEVPGQEAPASGQAAERGRGRVRREEA